MKTNMSKIFVTAPESHTEIIIKAMADSGAGVVGNYTHCATITKTMGNYMPENGANPYIGKVGEMSREQEDKIEMVCPNEKVEEVVKSIKRVHPYETPTIDVVTITFYS